MTTAGTTAVPSHRFLPNETHPERRARYAKTPEFKHILDFLLQSPEPITMDSVDSEMFGALTLSRMGLDSTPEDLELFVYVVGDTTNKPGAIHRTSPCGRVTIASFENFGLSLNVVDADAVVICLGNKPGLVPPSWHETFKEWGVPV